MRTGPTPAAAGRSCCTWTVGVSGSVLRNSTGFAKPTPAGASRPAGHACELKLGFDNAWANGAAPDESRPTRKGTAGENCSCTVGSATAESRESADAAMA